MKISSNLGIEKRNFSILSRFVLQIYGKKLTKQEINKIEERKRNFLLLIYQIVCVFLCCCKISCKTTAIKKLYNLVYFYGKSKLISFE